MRVIAATNRYLEREIEHRTFREDLYFRLSTVVINVPPLRERKTDVIVLVDHFLKTFSAKRALPEVRLSDECKQVLLNYEFPGNVRELEGEIARLVAICHPGEEFRQVP